MYLDLSLVQLQRINKLQINAMFASQVPIGGAYRLIDVPMSNCINSGINKVYILTQFNSQSLNRHLSRAYDFSNGVAFGDGFVEV
jgi:glucose-1-phosphate adenylyltransferase